MRALLFLAFTAALQAQQLGTPRGPGSIVAPVCIAFATQAEALAGTATTPCMNPLRTGQAIAAGIAAIPAAPVTATVQLAVSAAWDEATATGDGQYYFVVPARLNGLTLTGIVGTVVSVGATGTLTVQVARCAPVATGDTCSGTVADMLSTRLTIDSNEASSSTAATAAAINATNATVSTNQVLRVDVDAVHSTPAEGLILTLIFS